MVELAIHIEDNSDFSFKEDSTLKLIYSNCKCSYSLLDDKLG